MSWQPTPNWRQRHKFASTWVAGFWGLFGGALSVLPFMLDSDNIWWLGPLILLIAGTHAVALFTHQPGLE